MEKRPLPAQSGEIPDCCVGRKVYIDTCRSDRFPLRGRLTPPVSPAARKAGRRCRDYCRDYCRLPYGQARTLQPFHLNSYRSRTREPLHARRHYPNRLASPAAHQTSPHPLFAPKTLRSETALDHCSPPQTGRRSRRSVKQPSPTLTGEPGRETNCTPATPRFSGREVRRRSSRNRAAVGAKPQVRCLCSPNSPPPCPVARRNLCRLQFCLVSASTRMLTRPLQRAGSDLMRS